MLSAILDFGEFRKTLNRWGLALIGFGFSVKNPMGINKEKNLSKQNMVVNVVMLGLYRLI